MACSSKRYNEKEALDFLLDSEDDLSSISSEEEIDDDFISENECSETLHNESVSGNGQVWCSFCFCFIYI